MVATIRGLHQCKLHYLKDTGKSMFSYGVLSPEEWSNPFLSETAINFESKCVLFV